MKTYLVVYILIVVVLAGTAFGVTRHSYKMSAPAAGSSPAKGITIEEGSAPPVDYRDKRQMIGLLHNVFVGKVVKQLDTITYQGNKDPGVRFEVQPILNIKGNLQQPIIVTNFTHSGYVLLQPGSTYTIGARYNIWGEGVYSVSFSQYDYQLLTQDTTLSDEELKSLAVNDENVKALQAAYPNEILFKGDVEGGMTYNSYVSRRLDATGAVIDDTVELHKQFMATHPSATVDVPARSVAPTNAPAGDSVSSPVPSDASTSDVASSTPSTDAIAPGTDSPAPPADGGPAPSES